jgi:hypothetical protein
LLPDVGKIPLIDATLIEDPSEAGHDDEESLCSASTQSSNTLSTTDPVNANNRDFKIFVDGKSGQRHSIHLVAPTAQDKEAWISDISQCLDNIHMHSLLSPGIGTSGGKLIKLLANNWNKCLMSSYLPIPKLQYLQVIKRYALTGRCSKMTSTLDFLEHLTHANCLKYVTQLPKDFCKDSPTYVSYQSISLTHFCLHIECSQVRLFLFPRISDS